MSAGAKSDDTGSEGKGSGKERKAFLLRLPPEVYAEIKRWAARDLRSVNGQIEYLLREALRRRKKEGAG